MSLAPVRYVVMPSPDAGREASPETIAAEIAGALDSKDLPMAERGFDRAEVEAEMLGARILIRQAESSDDTERLARDLEEARFTPADGGFDPVAVRGLLARTVSGVRRLGQLLPSRNGTPVTEQDAADQIIADAKQAAAAIIRAAYDEAVALTAGDAINPEDANQRLRELLRQTARLRDEARVAIAQEMTEYRQRRLEEVNREIEERRAELG